MNKNGFSLLEVIIAAWILTLTFLWVYKLIWENIKIISNSDTYIQANILEKNIENCIKSIWFNYFKNNSASKYNFNLWKSWTWCFTWNTNITTIDNIPFYMNWEITNSWSNFINWKLNIISDWNTKINSNFIQLK